jgi:hypothetical protein
MKTVMARAILLGVFNLASLSTSIAEKPPSCDDTTLPAPIRDVLKSRFPQWRPKQVSDMGADDQQLWLNGPNGKGCPGITIGHFESADSLSYAFLLVQSNPSGGHKMVVISKGPTGDAYTWKLLDHADGQTYSGLVISKVEPGKYSDFEHTKSIQIKLDGVYVEWMEKGAQLYCWSGGRYHKLQVSD